MKEMLHKGLFSFLFPSLLGIWFIWGPFCPFCIDTHVDEGSCEESCESHHQDECRNCSGEFVKLHIHEKFVFTLSDRSRAGENPLAAATLTGKVAGGFQFREIDPVAVSPDSIYLSLELLRSVVMLT